MQAWLVPFLPLRSGLEIILRLLRESGKVLHFTAHHGSFQQMQGGRVAQMLRVSLSSDLACIPEVGANKYAINIRFIAANYAAKTTLFEQDVPFDLTFCSLPS
ncbi:MAG: cell division protein ZapD [Candidatus Ferrigenium altingense]